MILYSAITITLLYYLILWRVQSKKAALEHAIKEAIGPVTDIQALIDSNTSTLIINNEIATPHNEIFGAITNIKKLMDTTIPSSPTLENIPSLSGTDVLTEDSVNKIPSPKEKLRHQIFAGSSLAKEDTTITSNKNLVVKNKVTNLKTQALEKELEDIVGVLNEESAEENSPSTTTSLQTNDFLPSLKNSNLENQLHQLFEKDYQDVT